MSAPQEINEDNILTAAKDWSDGQVKEHLQDLFNFIHPVLLDKSSEYELRLDCVRIVADRLARYVPVYEAETSVFFPILTGVLEFLDQVFEAAGLEEDAENCAMLLSVATDLIDHTDSLLLQSAATYEGFGPGDLPSLPRVVPKILVAAFGYCVKERPVSSSDSVRSSIDQLFSRCRILLDNFSAIVDRLTFRSELEDELSLLAELCSDLVSFHQVLFMVDLKSSLNVWKLFSKLAREYCNSLRSVFDIQSALMVLLSESFETCRKIEQAIDNEEQSGEKKLQRMVITLTFLVKIIISLTEEYKNCVDTNLEVVYGLLRFMFLRGEGIFPRMTQQMKERMNKDLFSQNFTSLLHTIPDIDKFVDYIIREPIDAGNALSNVLLIMPLLLENDSVIVEMKMSLLDVVLKSFGECGADLQRDAYLDSVEAQGALITRVGCYEWTLTRLCRFICVLGPDQFANLEVLLFQHIIDGDNCWSVQELCSDIICFISRYATVDLAYAHMELLSCLYLELSSSSHQFSTARFWVGILVGRLFNFLGRRERDRWVARFTPVDPVNIPLWTLVSLHSLEDKAAVSLVRDVTLGHAQIMLDGDEFSAALLTNRLLLLDEVGKECPEDVKCAEAVLAVWQHLDNYKVTYEPSYWMEELFYALGNVTVSVFPVLDTDQVKFIISCLSTMLAASNKRTLTFLFTNVLPLLHEISRMEKISRIESMDAGLLTEIGCLSSVALRSAVGNPVLRRSGLKFLKTISERSSNPGFIRLCSDESDVMPHFTLFLKEETSSRSINSASFLLPLPDLDTFPGLERLINEFEESGGRGGGCGGDSIKRRLTSHSATSSPRKKRFKAETREISDKPKLSQNKEEQSFILDADKRVTVRESQEGEIFIDIIEDNSGEDSVVGRRNTISLNRTQCRELKLIIDKVF